jgi:hypothetical protein
VTVTPADGSAAVAPLAGEIATAGPAGEGLALALALALPPAPLAAPVLAAGAAAPLDVPPASCVLLVQAAASSATMTVTVTAAARCLLTAFAARITRTRPTFSRLPSSPSGLGFPAIKDDEREHMVQTGCTRALTAVVAMP